MTVAIVAKNEYFEKQPVQCKMQMTEKISFKRHNIIVYIIVLMIIYLHHDHGTNFIMLCMELIPIWYAQYAAKTE